MELGFLRTLDDDELRAALAHEFQRTEEQLEPNSEKKVWAEEFPRWRLV
jgi:hypothetical protein